MSALATALKRLGDEVTGADRTLGTPNVKFLESIGIKVFPDDGSGIDDTTDEVIVSTAIEETNPGIIKARAAGLPITHRAAALARALSSKRLVAVAGTCGKSTVTAMLGHLLQRCGLDPICVNGANVPGWEGAFRMGAGEYAVAEIDESDKSLVAFKPYAAIITNSSADHYSKEEMDEVFDAFIKDAPGPVIDGRKGDARLSSATAEAELSSVLRMPGKHNFDNAVMAITMAVRLGVQEAEAIAAFADFAGVARRLQCYGENVYDDYAHNPEKIAAMWKTVAERHQKGVCVIWRPHGYAPLRKMLAALAAMFKDVIRPQDKLLLLPVYDAGGTADRSINSDALAAMLPAAAVMQVADLDSAYEWCRVHLSDYSAFVTCGARDPDLPQLAVRIAEAGKQS